MTEKDAYILGYLVAKFDDGGVWAYRRMDIYYPDHELWFTYLEKDLRSKHGTKIESVG